MASKSLQIKIAGAALDVYDAEPLPADHPLRKLDNAMEIADQPEQIKLAGLYSSH